MKGYSKIKENNPFSHKSKSKKQTPFLDQHFNEQQISDNINTNYNGNFDEISPTKKTQQNDQKPNKNEVLFDGEEIKKGPIMLKRNYTISSSSSSSSGKNNYCSNLERQGSKRVVIQEAVKRAFSMRRSSSANNSSSSSDKYSRIFDQPNNVEDEYYSDNINNNNNNNNNNNYDGININDDDDGGEFERRRKVKKGEYLEGKKLHVGSKVVRACKRIFSL